MTQFNGFRFHEHESTAGFHCTEVRCTGTEKNEKPYVFYFYLKLILTDSHYSQIWSRT